MSDLGVNKLARVQLIFRLFKMVFSHQKYKVSPEAASLKLVLWLWWLVIAFLPFSLWSTAAIWGMSVLSHKLGLLLRAVPYIELIHLWAVLLSSYRLEFECVFHPSLHSQNVLGGCNPVVLMCVLLSALMYRELNWVAQSCQLYGFYLTFKVWPSPAFNLFYVPKYILSHYRHWLQIPCCGNIFLAWSMQPGWFTCGHFHFLFLCLLLLAITNCSGMFAFLLFNRRKFFVKTVKTFSWSDDCKSQFLQNLGESLWWVLLGFYFPVQPYSVAWEKEQGTGPDTAADFTSDSYSASDGSEL